MLSGICDVLLPAVIAMSQGSVGYQIVTVLLTKYLFQVINVRKMWEQKTIDLGEVKIRTTVPFTFMYKGSKDILTITPACSCTDVVYIKPLLQGSLNISSFPTYGLVNAMERITINKTIDILFTDNSRETLSLTADLLNPNIH